MEHLLNTIGRPGDAGSETGVVGRGEIQIAHGSDSALKTTVLGAGVAVAVYDPMTSAVALLHVVFPHSSVSQRQASRKPGQFADTGIAALVNGLREIGTDLEANNCIVTLAGAGQTLGTLQPFAIGAETLAAVRGQLKAHGLVAAAEDVAGHKPRTLSVCSTTGDMCVTINGKQSRLL